MASVDNPFKALVFDSNFDHYRGVVANIAVFGGRVKKGDKIVSAHLRKTYEVNELGLLRPDEHPTQKLYVVFSLISSSLIISTSWYLSPVALILEWNCLLLILSTKNILIVYWFFRTSRFLLTFFTCKNCLFLFKNQELKCLSYKNI